MLVIITLLAPLVKRDNLIAISPKITHIYIWHIFITDTKAFLIKQAKPGVKIE